jgi:hypothetical protein
VEELARGTVRPERQEAQPDVIRIEPTAAWSVPETLRDSLMARLDRAPDARKMAQMAAVIGREFSYNMLSRVSSLSSPQLQSTLDHLEQNGVIQAHPHIHAMRSCAQSLWHTGLPEIA